MKKIFKILSFCLIFVLALSFTACTNPFKSDDDVIVEEEIEIETPAILISSGEAVINEDGTVSKILTATVLPVDAPNKSVDWSVEWLENNEGEEAIVTDYVTVTPTEDGALTATVTAHKSFLGSKINVVCITRVGNYRATCTATCSGAPEYMSIDFEGMEYLNGSEMLTLKAGEIYSFDLDLFNTLGEISEEYGMFEIENYGGYGKFLANKTFGDSTEEIVMDLEHPDSPYILMPFFFTCKIDENGKLNVVVNANEKTYYYDMLVGFSHTVFEYKGEYQYDAGNVSDCVFFVKVKEINSGVTLTINFDIESTVTDVNLDSNSLVF